MRRKFGALVPLEEALCQAALRLRQQGIAEFHGYFIAKVVNVADIRRLTAYGSVYRALARLVVMGLVECRWEDPLLAAAEGRPVRRLYSLTQLGMQRLDREI
jgi:PadR family transcriptional regulator, regulatory protein PadR